MGGVTQEQSVRDKSSTEGQYRTLYDVLEVSPAASPEVLNAAWRALARIRHPDRNPTAEAAGMMHELNEAYNILRDPKQRAEYDSALKRITVVTPGPSWKGIRRQRSCWSCNSALDPFSAYCSDCRWLVCDTCLNCGCQNPTRKVEVTR